MKKNREDRMKQSSYEGSRKKLVNMYKKAILLKYANCVVWAVFQREGFKDEERKV